MSLRHITHFPFQAKKVVLINLQATPDDEKAHLRIWAKCDPVFIGLMERLGIEIDPIPAWRPRDSVPIEKIPKFVHSYYVEAAKRLEEVALLREAEAEEREQEKQKEKEKEKEEEIHQEKEKEKEKEKGEKAKQRKAKKKNAPLRLELGNTHEKVKVAGTSKDTWHKWTLFLRPADEETRERFESEVEWVEFDLHPTFTPSVVRVDAPPFELTRTGWGYFDVGVSVQKKKHLKASRPVHLSHQLDFNSPETYREVSL